MTKLLTLTVVTLAAANVMAAVQSSSSQISNAIGQAVLDLSATKPSQTNTAGTYDGAKGESSASSAATGVDARAAKENVKKAYHKTAAFLGQYVSAPVKASVLGAVDTLEYSGNAVTVGTTGMTGAVTADSGAVSNAQVSQTNTAGVAAGTSNAQTLAATGADTVASGAFTSAPVEQVKAFKRKQEEKRQLAHAFAAEVRENILFVGPTSKEGIAELATMGDMVSSLTGVELPTLEARVIVGATMVFGGNI